MRLISCLFMLTGTLAMAQGPSFTNQQQTTGVIGIVSGQTARLTLLYPSAPAPIAQVLCSATLTISNTQGTVLKSTTFPSIIAGNSVSIDVDADGALSGAGRIEIYGFSFGQPCGGVVANLQIIDATTQKTLLTIPAELTFPATSTPAPSAARP